MKFITLACVVFCSAMLGSEAAIAKVRYHNPSYPGKCTIDSNTIMSLGEKGKAPNNPCAGVTCLEDSVVEYKTCTPVAPPKGCKQREYANTERPFPDCCERKYECTQLI